MPNYKTHLRITKTSQVLFLPAILIDWRIGLGICLGHFITYWFNPDTDIVGRGILKNYFKNIYVKQIPHRYGLRKKHWIGIRKQPLKILTFSHIPFFGTIGRFTLLFWLVFIFPWIGLGIFIGMVLSDLWHILADLLS